MFIRIDNSDPFSTHVVVGGGLTILVLA